MNELLFLLLPLAAVYGYYMGRASARRQREEQKRKSADSYLRGVDYLLNNDKARAVDKFIAYLNTTDPSFESKLALGNLFRQRGEIDKSISLHESLSSDEKLNNIENELARLELARDFISAGLLDRAEEIIKSLIEIPGRQRSAAMLLINIYEREHDYAEAVKASIEYSDALGRSMRIPLSHYYCELAARQQIKGDFNAVKEKCRQALAVWPEAVRPRLLMADTLIREHKLTEALHLVKEVSKLDPDSGMQCLDLIHRIFENAADPQLRLALEDLVRCTKSAAAMVDLVDAAAASNAADAEMMLLSFIKEKPNLKLFSALMRWRARDNNANGNDAIWQLKSLVDAQLVGNNRYVCHHCGFESRILFWQCPSCRTWNSMKPRRGLDGD